MVEQNLKLNELFVKHNNYQQQADLYNDRSQEFFNVGQHKLAVKYDQKFCQKQKQLKLVNKKISQLKSKIDKQCKIVDHTVLKIPTNAENVSIYTYLIVDFTNKYRDKKYSIHTFLTKTEHSKEDVIVLVVNTKSLSQIKVEKLFKDQELLFNEDSWVFPMNEQSVEDESIDETKYQE